MLQPASFFDNERSQTVTAPCPVLIIILLDWYERRRTVELAYGY